MQQRSSLRWLTGLFFILLLIGCKNQEKRDNAREAGSHDYRRIISTSIAGDTLLIDVLPNSELTRIVGLSKLFDNYGLESSKEKISRYSIPEHFTFDSLESLLLYQPDLVITSDWAMNVERKTLLLDIGVNLFVLNTVTTLPALYDQMRELASILGSKSEDEVEAIILHVKEIEQRISRRAEVFHGEYPEFLRVLDWNTSGQTAGSNSTFDLVMTLLGLQNLGRSLDGESSSFGYAPISEEALFLLNPDILIVDVASFERIQSEAIFRNLKAVQNNMVIVLDGELEKMFYSPTYHIIFAALSLQEEILDRVRALARVDQD